MEFLGYLLIAMVVLFLISSGKGRGRSNAVQDKKKGSDAPQASGSTSAGAADSLAQLREHWALAARSRGTPNAPPDWFFDPVTERQMDRLAESRTRLPREKLTKGMASDLIGLGEPLEDEHAEVLRFFKVSLRGMNQTLGRYEVRRLMADVANQAAWDARPADQMQKEFFRFFGLAVPKTLTNKDAAATITSIRAGRSEHKVEDEKLAEWQAFEDIVEELWDADFRECYGLKKPALSAIRAAVNALRAEGNTIDALRDDIDSVADKLVEMKPELEKAD